MMTKNELDDFEIEVNGKKVTFYERMMARYGESEVEKPLDKSFILACEKINIFREDIQKSELDKVKLQKEFIEDLSFLFKENKKKKGIEEILTMMISDSP